MNILVTGSNGQLGSELRQLAKASSASFVFTDEQELDITKEKSLDDYLKKQKIDFLINCAAYTAVDKAQENGEVAYQLNATGPMLLAQMSVKYKFILVHISTDYIFNGKTCMPYKEDDVKLPQSVYGRTKLEGEVEVLLNAKQAIIIRTSWLYSAFGQNFVKTIIRKGRELQELNVVCDQVGTPTYAADLATAILQILPQVGKIRGTEIYHFSNEGVCSWYDFAKEIAAQTGLTCRINPVESKDYQTPAPRPSYSVLNKSKIKQQYNLVIPHWKDGLTRCITNLKV